MKLNTFLLGFGLPLMLMLFLCHRHLRHIAADIKESQNTGNQHTQAKMPTLDSLIANLSGYGSNYQAGAIAMYEAVCRHFGCA